MKTKSSTQRWVSALWVRASSAGPLGGPHPRPHTRCTESDAAPRSSGTRRSGTGGERRGAAAGPETTETPRPFPAQSRPTGQKGDAPRTHDWAVTRQGRKDVSNGQEGDRLVPPATPPHAHAPAAQKDRQALQSPGHRPEGRAGPCSLFPFPGDPQPEPRRHVSGRHHPQDQKGRVLVRRHLERCGQEGTGEGTLRR